MSSYISERVMLQDVSLDDPALTVRAYTPAEASIPLYKPRNGLGR